MRGKPVRYLLVFALALVLTGCASQQQQAFKSIEGKTHTAITPGVQTAEWASQWWMPRFESNNARLAQGNVDLLWIGDSITHGWENTGREYLGQVLRQPQCHQHGIQR